MPKAVRYQQGQRWGYSPQVAGFEQTLVLGTVMDPVWDTKDLIYTVYVRYAEAMKESIASNYDGVIVILGERELDRSVSILVESGVPLPSWKAVHGCSGNAFDRVSDELARHLVRAEQCLELIRVRKEALRKHHEKYGALANRSESSKCVAESWKRIEAWYAENAHELSASLAPGASETAMNQFEGEIGASLPDDFKESVRVHNGGWWVPWRHGDLLSLDAILKEWRMYSEWQAAGEWPTPDDVVRDSNLQIKPVFWNKRRIFITANSGNHLTLDLDPPAEDLYGQIIKHSREEGPIVVVARGWGEFLMMLVSDLEAGKYIPMEGSVELVEYVERQLAEDIVSIIGK